MPSQSNQSKSQHSQRESQPGQSASVGSSQVSVESSQVSVESSQVSVEPSQVSPGCSQVSLESSQMSLEPSQVSPECSQVSLESSQVSLEHSQVSPEPSQVSSPSQVASSQGTQGPVPSSSNPPLLHFLSNIRSKDPRNDAVFDPERVGSDDSEVETDSDEGQAFREKALLARKEPPANLVRTRSQTSSENDLVGKIVFAHKGKSVPFWFPGKVLKKTTKGYEIEFLTRFGVEVCTSKNVMPYDYYFMNKGDSSALFKIPAKYKRHLKKLWMLPRS